MGFQPGQGEVQHGLPRGKAHALPKPHQDGLFAVGEFRQVLPFPVQAVLQDFTAFIFFFQQPSPVGVLAGNRLQAVFHLLLDLPEAFLLLSVLLPLLFRHLLLVGKGLRRCST